MSFLNFFGKSTKVESPSPQKVIQNMRGTLSTMEKREVHLEKRIESLNEEARSLVKTNKQKALMLLKKAKMNEKQLLSIYGQKENMETQILVLEQGINNQNTIESMKQGKNAIENMTKKLDPDHVGELVDDIATGMDMAEEIATALSVPIGQVYDEDALLAEFEEEEQEKERVYVPKQTIDIDRPSVPVKKIQTEEEELAELVAMM
jgi:hypothetical protein